VLVEDEEFIANYLIQELRECGAKVSWFNSGESALKFLKSNKVQCVVLDVSLTDCCGLDICKKIRWFSEVPVILLTSSDNEINRAVGSGVGADDYLNKPVPPNELLSRIHGLYQRSLC
jgi:DNA-binding response OmpR family regulator